MLDLGLDSADTTYHVAGQNPASTEDAAESNLAVTKPLDLDPPSYSPQQDGQQAISRIVGVLISSPNVKLDAAALAFALNLDALNGLGTQAQWCKTNLISATMLSRRVEFWRKLLDQPYGRHQKDATARQTFSAATSQDHWRKRTTATHAHEKSKVHSTSSKNTRPSIKSSQN